MGPFPYSLNIPAEDHNPSDDQPDMQDNTNSINTIIGVDHFQFASAQAGFHQKSTYIEGSDPGSAAGQYVQYSKAVAGSGELFVQKDGTATPIQVSRGVPATNGNGSFSYLPGGFLIQWGSQTASGNIATVTFPISFTSNPTSVTATCRNLANVYTQVSIQPPSSGGVVINVKDAGQTIYWMAIGV